MNMTVREMYNEAIIDNYPSLIYLIEWLVYEKKVLTMDRDARNVVHIIKHPTKNIWPEVNPYIAKRKEMLVSGTQKTGSASGA